MLNARTDWYQANRLVLLALLVITAVPAFAVEQKTWQVIASELESSRVEVRSPTARPIDPDFPFFVVTHGMGGTSDGDRFHRLADAIASTCPRANVLLVDWSESSCEETDFFGIHNPFVVANRIDPVGDDAAAILCELQFDPHRATLIGESFGNWVNARIANKFGGVHRVVAMNPASELGGYPPPDLCACARISWAFHAYCVFDTLKKISHASILLATRPESSDLDRHTCGIGRLTSQLSSGDRSWLLTEVELQEASDTSFNTLATQDGQLVNGDFPRARPIPKTEAIASTSGLPAI
jgi:hypothetical protein